MLHSDTAYFKRAEGQAREALNATVRCLEAGDPGNAAVWGELAEHAGRRAKDGRCFHCDSGTGAHRVTCPARGERS